MWNRNQCAAGLGAAVGVSVTFVLEVVGAAGAIWGGSEVTGLRDEHNAHRWDLIAFGVAGLAMLRFILKFSTARQEAPLLPIHTNPTFAQGTVCPEKVIAALFRETPYKPINETSTDRDYSLFQQPNPETICLTHY